MVDKTRPQKKIGIPRKIMGPQRSCAGAFTFSPDGRTFVVAMSEFKHAQSNALLDFYNVKTWKRIRVCQDLKLPPTQGVRGGRLQWSRDGQVLLVSWSAYSRQSLSSEMRISLWNPRDGKRITSATFQNRTVGSGLPTSVTAPTFELQNDRRVLSIDVDGRVFLSPPDRLALGTKPVFSLPTEPVTAAMMPPDGSYLLAGMQSGRVFWKQVK